MAEAAEAGPATKPSAPQDLPDSAPPVPPAEHSAGQKQCRRKRQGRGQQAQQPEPEATAGQIARPSKVHVAPGVAGSPEPASPMLAPVGSLPAIEAAPAALTAATLAAAEEEGGSEDAELQSLLQALGLGAPPAPVTPCAAPAASAVVQQQSPGGQLLGMLAPASPAPAAAGPAPGAAPDTSCVCCMERQRETVLVPCGHRAFCMPCARSMFEGQQGRPCPFCRTEVGAGGAAVLLLFLHGLHRRGPAQHSRAEQDKTGPD